MSVFIYSSCWPCLPRILVIVGVVVVVVGFDSCGQREEKGSVRSHYSNGSIVINVIISDQPLSHFESGANTNI